MHITILPAGAIVVKEGDTSWLFGAPEGIKDQIEAAGYDVPPVVFLTQMRAPGYTSLGRKMMRFKEQPLRMDDLRAEPIKSKHGTDYAISTDQFRVLFSERGDVSVEDVEGYDLAVIRNKHRADGFGENVITWPWPEADYKLPLIAEKVWSDMADVPDNLKKIDGTSLTLAQANSVAKVAEVTGKDGKENWAIAISQFKKGHIKKDGSWMKREKEMTDAGPIRRFGDILISALHTAYNDVSDQYYGKGFMDETERIAIGKAIGEALSALRAAAPDDVMKRVIDTPFMTGIIKDKGGWVSVFKDADGNWRWFGISSAAMLDRHGEYLSRKAMDFGIKLADVVGKGPLRYRHIPGLDGGDCDRQCRVGDFMFESGLFRDTPLGLAMRTKMQKEPTGQLSLGVLYSRNDLLHDMFYTRAAFFERSMTKAPAVPATAVLTIGGNLEMTVKKLTDDELKQAAKELEMDFEEIKALHDQALKNDLGPFNLKEFTEAATKAKDAKADKAAKDDDEDEDEDELTEEQKKEALQEVLRTMSTTERKELGAMLTEANAEPTDVQILRQLKDQTLAIAGLAEAIRAGATQSQGGSSTEAALIELFTQTPRGQAGAGFATGRKEAGAARTINDEAILKALKEISEKVDGNQPPGWDNTAFYNTFTSEDLNRDGGGE